MDEMPIHAAVESNSLGIRTPGSTGPSVPVRRVTIERAAAGSGVVLRYWSEGGTELQSQELGDLAKAKQLAERECQFPPSAWRKGTK